jgi:hypothetical protein
VKLWRYNLEIVEPYSKKEPWNKNKSISQEIKNKLSNSKKGKPWSDARRQAQINKQNKHD